MDETSDSWRARYDCAEKLCKYIDNTYIVNPAPHKIDQVIIELIKAWKHFAGPPDDIYTRMVAAEDVCRYIDQTYMPSGDLPQKIPPVVDSTMLIFARDWSASLSM